jgi:hypothetical protein
MITTSRISPRVNPAAAALTVAFALGACADRTPVAPDADLTAATAEARMAGEPGAASVFAELRRATVRYRHLEAALADGFVLIHPCEERPGEGPVGAVYGDPTRFDATLDPSAPEALIYEPGPGGRMKLVGVEMVIPYAVWMDADPPEFLGVSFQREDEFGVFGLHFWVWKHNPEGMFAPSNPRVSCDADA